MRSEDRKPSKRVFPLLQNLDLEAVTFAQVQGVGDPITIEDMNEQEMVDLIIVNLARLVCAGEWTGLLEAGGGGATFPPLVAPNLMGGYTGIAGQTAAGVASTFDMSANIYFDESFYYPFLATFDGDLAELKFNVSTAGTSGTNLEVGIYSESNGLPNALLGSATVAVDSTGDKTVTSFSSTITLEAGTMYFFAFVRDVANDNIVLKALTTVSFGWIPVNTTSQVAFNILSNGEDDLNLPATVTQSTNLTGLARAVPIVMIKP